MTAHFFHLDHANSRANLPVSDHTYIFCLLSKFCQIVSEMIDFLGSGVRK